MVKHDPQELIKRGHAAMNNFQPEAAAQFFTRALESDSNNIDLMDTLADVLLQIGEAEKALPLLQRSITVAPNASPYKYLYIAQLQNGKEALSSIEMAVALLTRDFTCAKTEAQNSQTQMDLSEGNGNVISAAFLQKQLAKAHCSIAELFLTDLCDEEHAEQSCEKALAAAAQVDPESLDVLQTLASVRISQCRSVEAGEIMDRVSSRVLVALERAQKETIASTTEPQSNTHVFRTLASGFEEAPEHQFCVSTAKLLVECACANPSLAERAMDLAEMLLEEDDENVELWYIMGMAALGAQPPDTETAIYHLDHAKEMLVAARERFGASESSDSMLAMVEQRLAEAHAVEAEGAIAAEAEEDIEVS